MTRLVFASFALLVAALVCRDTADPAPGATSGGKPRLVLVVVDESGGPIGNASVELERRALWKEPQLRRADAEGRCEVELPKPLNSSIRVAAWAPGFCEEYTFVKIEGDLTEARIELAASCGSLSWPDGTPVESAKGIARLGARAAPLQSASVIVRRGEFVVDTQEMPIARLALWLDDEQRGRFVAVAEDVRCGADLHLALGPGRTLRGNVVDDQGRPVPTFRVVARRGASMIESMLGMESVERSFTSRDGSFALQGLTPGTWSVGADSDAPSASVAATVEVAPDEEPPPLDVVLPRPAALHVRVVDGDGEGIAGAEVRVSLPLGTVDLRSDIHAVTDAQGRLELRTWSNAHRVTCYLRPGPVASSLHGEPLELDLAPGEVREIVFRP